MAVTVVHVNPITANEHSGIKIGSSGNENAKRRKITPAGGESALIVDSL
jgi:hypothetical protein